MLRVLGAHGVAVSSVEDGDIRTYVLKKNGVRETQPFTEQVRRRILFRLAVKFGIEPEFFFPSAQDTPMPSTEPHPRRQG